MLDHLSIGVTDLDRAQRFYDAVLEPLGYARFKEYEDSTGYADADRSSAFFIVRAEMDPSPIPAYHVAFIAPTRAAVDEFHESALAGGATNDGDPGIRARYHDDYYAAYVIDLDGHRIEAVCQRSE